MKKLKIQRKLRQNEGAALLIVLALMGAAAMLSASFYVMLNITLSDTYRQGREQIAVNLAEAGLDQAIAMVRSGKKDYAGEKNIPLGEGFFSTTVTPVDGAVKTWRIASKGVAYPGKKGFTRKMMVTATLALDGKDRIARLTWGEAAPCH